VAVSTAAGLLLKTPAKAIKEIIDISAIGGPLFKPATHIFQVDHPSQCIHWAALNA
jgi:hypothetical protein